MNLTRRGLWALLPGAAYLSNMDLLGNDGESCLMGCLIKRRKDDDASWLFSVRDGHVVCQLKHYAIVPLEDVGEVPWFKETPDG